MDRFDDSRKRDPVRNALSWSERYNQEAQDNLLRLPRQSSPADVVFGHLERISRDLGRVRAFDDFHPRTMRHVARRGLYQAVDTVDVGSAVLCFSAAADGTRIAGLQDKRVVVWAPGAPLARFTSYAAHTGAVQALDTLPDGRFVTAGTDNQVRVWTRIAGEELYSSQKVPWSTSQVNKVLALPGEMLLCACDDGVMRLGNLAAQKCEELRVASPDMRPSLPFSCALVRPNGDILGGRDQGDVVMWANTPRGRNIIGFFAQRGSLLTCMGYLSDGRLVTGGSDMGLLVHTRTESSWAGMQLSDVGGGWINDLQVLPDDRILFGTTRGRVQIVCARTGVSERLVKHENQVRCVQMAPDGTAFSADDLGLVVQWGGR